MSTALLLQLMSPKVTLADIHWRAGDVSFRRQSGDNCDCSEDLMYEYVP